MKNRICYYYFYQTTKTKSPRNGMRNFSNRYLRPNLFVVFGSNGLSGKCAPYCTCNKETNTRASRVQHCPIYDPQTDYNWRPLLSYTGFFKNISLDFDNFAMNCCYKFGFKNYPSRIIPLLTQTIASNFAMESEFCGGLNSA